MVRILRKLQGSGLAKTDKAPVIHLYRALLRECTYLPDPTARQYLKQHVVARFHANQTTPPRRGYYSKRTTAVLGRRSSLIKTGQKDLRTLCRANHGHHQALSKVLELAYGRKGPRRYELMESLKSSDPDTITASNLEDLGRQLKDLESLNSAKLRVPTPSPQLEALLRSQLNRKESLLPQKPLKHLTPQIPETNIWGRPTPKKRVRNIQRRWYAKALGRVQPPLPESDWEMLRKKAFGEIVVAPPVRRSGLSGEGNIGKLMYKADRRIRRPHNITARYMRRRWIDVFQQCPLIKEDPSKNFGWQVTWSDPKAETKVGFNSMTAGHNIGFDGVDENGKLLS